MFVPIIKTDIMNLNELTAMRIKELRATNNLSAETLAKELGISKTAFSQLENGHVEITINKIDALAKIFHVPVSALLPQVGSISQIVHGGGSNIGGGNNTINNFYSTPEDKLQEIADKLNTTIAEMKSSRKP